VKSRTALTALQARAKAASERTAHARVTTSPHGGAESTSRELWLYGTVGGYWWGFDADDVAETLRGMGEDVDDILVRLHSFGGNAIEGIAIANLLANHPANVRVVVDGIAASAASVIALAGSELVMSPGSQMMVHDPWMLTVGNAAELRAEADLKRWEEQRNPSAAASAIFAVLGLGALDVLILLPILYRRFGLERGAEVLETAQ